MGHVAFVSYSSKDHETALAVVAGLERAGIPCWIAPRDISAGDVWAEAIVTAIAKARVFVLVFSSHANRSSHIVNEVDAAVRKGAIVVPFRIEDVMPEGAMEYHLRTRHWLDATGPDRAKNVADLVATVQALKHQPGQGVPQTEFLKVTPAPVAPVAPPRRMIETTESGFHLKVPRPPRRLVGLPARRIGLGLAAIAILVVGGRWLLGKGDVTGVEFTVIESTPGSDSRVSIRSKSIRFFESGSRIPQYGSRTYTKNFVAAQTRYINTEVTIQLEAPRRILNVPLSCTIYNKAGGVTGTFTLENQVAPNDTEWQSARGWGSEKGGTWIPGHYRVDCVYGEQLVARGLFEIFG